MFVLSCIHVNHLCILYLYYFLVVVHRGPHGRLAFFFFLLNVLPSENKDYYYYYYYFIKLLKTLTQLDQTVMEMRRIRVTTIALYKYLIQASLHHFI